MSNDEPKYALIEVTRKWDEVGAVLDWKWIGPRDAPVLVARELEQEFLEQCPWAMERIGHNWTSDCAIYRRGVFQ